MNLAEIKNKDQYNNFVASQKHSQFLQSWEWGEFQAGAGFKIKRFGIETGGTLIFTATIIKKALPLGKSYFYLPRLHVTHNTKHVTDFLFTEIKKIAQKEKVIFLRFEPKEAIHDSRFTIKRTIDVQPSKTLMLDLEKSEEELLKEMHQKTRYNIRLAEKKGVKVYEAGQEKFEEFWKIMEQTKERDAFRLHGKEYYKKMLAVDFIKLYLAEYDNKIIAGNVISFFGDMATYVHGASGNEHRNVMAPFLLQWELIKKAKARGFKYYDFYGVDENKWPGVTRFKKGFSNQEISYPGTFDLVFKHLWYNVYMLVRKIKRLV